MSKSQEPARCSSCSRLGLHTRASPTCKNWSPTATNRSRLSARSARRFPQGWTRCFAKWWRKIPQPATSSWAMLSTTWRPASNSPFSSVSFRVCDRPADEHACAGTHARTWQPCETQAYACVIRIAVFAIKPNVARTGHVAPSSFGPGDEWRCCHLIDGATSLCSGSDLQLSLRAAVEKAVAFFQIPKRRRQRSQSGRSILLPQWARAEVVTLADERHRCSVRSNLGFSGHLSAKSSEFRPARPSRRVDGTLHGASKNVSEIAQRPAPCDCVTGVV